MARVKICGINSEAALAAAVEAGTDWVGFVFFPPSPRSVTAAAAARLASRTGDAMPIGLFVDPDDTVLQSVLAICKLAGLQIHDAAPGRLAAIRARFGLPVWRAVGIAGLADLPAEAAGADLLVLDAKAPPDAPVPGGNAQSFDWGLVRLWQAPLPWILAGGLTPDNVAEAIRTTGAEAVDVTSGVESARGVKEPALIRAFVTAAKAA